MTPEQFTYWLQGFSELTDNLDRPSAAQWQAIKDHLQTVFLKVTPPVLSISAHPLPDITGPHYPGLVDRVTC